MDEVKAMTRAGEKVGRVVGTGLQAMRHSAQRAGQAAEHKLAEHGVAPKQLTEALTESAQVAREEAARTTRRARRKLGRKAKHARKELAKAAKQARKEAKMSKPAKAVKEKTKEAKKVAKQAAKEAGQKKSRRRWPILLGFAGLAAGIAYLVRRSGSGTDSMPQQRTEESTPASEQKSSADKPASGDGHRNGQTAERKPAAKRD